MKPMVARPLVASLSMVCLTLLLIQCAFSQEADTLRNISTPSLEFQLFGGAGLFYVNDCSPFEFIRVGIDGSWNHSHQSGGWFNLDH
jgi:hypothetical protein